MRIRRILCPIDFLPPSLQAAEYAIHLGKVFAAQLSVLHVVSPILYGSEFYHSSVAEVIRALEMQASKKMQQLQKKGLAAGVDVVANIRTGDVEREIETAIRTKKTDLVVMGTHGRHGLERWFLGSVTEKVLRRSPVPVLTLRGVKKGRSAPSFRRILVTTDFSAGTSRALDYAMSIANVNNARVTLLNVMEETRAITSPSYREELATRIQGDLSKLVPATARASTDIETRVEAGTAYHAICRMIKKDKIDLVVMNMQGKGMLDRALLGSTSERVVRSADCPVLLIPPAGTRLRRA